MNLQHHFLIAMPGMDDPLFQRTVVYVCEHNEEGAMGLIINKPLENLKVDDVLAKLDIATTYHSDKPKLAQTVYKGGPLDEDRGFILQSNVSSKAQPDTALLTTSRQVLELLGQEPGNSDILVTLGYCSWEKDQLENEILKNAWLTAPACNDILFTTPISDRWMQAGKLIGVDMFRMSLSAGHA